MNWESRICIALMVFKNKDTYDIRKYMVDDTSRNRNIKQTAQSENNVSVAQDHKKQRQMNLGIYFHLPAMRLGNEIDWTPRAIRKKRSRPSCNQPNLDDMTRKCKTLKWTVQIWEPVIENENQ